MTEEDMIEAVCPPPDGCGRTYKVLDEEEACDPNRLCPECFEAWNGATLEELLK